MAEQIPPGDEPSDSVSEPVDFTDNPPEPTLSIPRNDSLSASIRAERGSPAPEAIDIDSLPDTPAGSRVQLQDPTPSSSTRSNVPLSIADPFQLPTFEPTPSVPQGTEPPPEPSSVACPSHPVDPQGIQVNPVFLSHLIEFGIDEWTAQLALKRTANLGVDQALQWIFERSNVSDFESEDSDSAEEDGPADEDMGAAQSGEAAGNVAADAAANVVRQLARNARTHKMVFVANMSLKMGTGKLAAQVGHACLGVYQQAMKTDAGRGGIESWQRLGAVKIVLKGESTEQMMDMFKAAKDAGCNAYLVQDAGYTQIPPGSRTVLGIFGPVEAVDSVTGGLKLL